ncbi:NTP transferase domain-containing protein [Candidatus Daviesbacteria bacterium]|nr:NTP transferase domain-containing protein [Candidatus Daviesbacteria bacterium]
MFDDLAAIILAAGKGTRLNSKDINKVTLEVGGIPIIIRIINILRETGTKNILVVVGFAKDSVEKLLDKDVKTVEQANQLGTGDAVKIALDKISANTKNILILMGDDAYLYSPAIFNNFYKFHLEQKSDLTFLTTVLENTKGLGRVIRNENGNPVRIVEDNDASDEIKKINEVNLGCYIFKMDFLRKYIDQIQKSPITGEYYLVDLIEIAIKNARIVRVYTLENFSWRGINTKEELEEAQKLI